MKQVYLAERKEEESFALKAAKHFERHPEHSTYTAKEVEAGCFFAVKWGAKDDGVLVFKLDESFEPQNYCNIIKQQENKDAN